MRIEQREKIPSLQALYKPSGVPTTTTPLLAAQATPVSPPDAAEVNIPTVVAVAYPL